jgi:hypothetical protein
MGAFRGNVQFYQNSVLKALRKDVFQSAGFLELG